MKKVSICVPTYEMRGRGAEFLSQLIASVFIQTYRNWEIIISDHSVTDEIKNVVDKLPQTDRIKYFRCENKRGNIASNLNNAIAQASGDLIKFLLQDDFFHNEESLETEVENLRNADWGLCATIHLANGAFHWHLIPEYTHNIYTGANTIGSPSLLICKKEKCLQFDENLKLLVDCDYYRRMYDNYGYPITNANVTTVSRVWEGQTQRSGVDEQTKANEQVYVNKKYSGPSN